MRLEREQLCFLGIHYHMFNLHLFNQELPTWLFSKKNNMQNDIDELTNKLKHIQTKYKKMEQEWLNDLETSKHVSKATI